MHKAAPLLIYEYNSPQNRLKQIISPQASYLCAYLEGLHAKTVIEEQNYFDRDYLDEFAEFYSQSSRGYPNICRRLHFFSTDKIDRSLLEKAASNNYQAKGVFQSSYLGFIVIRPISSAPLGRTVLKWFTDKEKSTNPRITTPSRRYTSNLTGLELKIHSLAWQQQDTGVSACATVSLWSMFHSSAFDAHHSIPTTAQITKSAHLTASLGSRVFPSKGLSVSQILEAIKAQNLAPAMTSGDLHVPTPGGGLLQCFSKKKLASSCAAFIRSGYPVLILGRYTHFASTDGHMICAVGFRDSTTYEIDPGQYAVFDEAVDVIYIHDDNIGPNVRCTISEDPGNRAAIIETSPPPYAHPDTRAPATQHKFLPEAIIVAVHEELRISSDDFFLSGMAKTHNLSNLLNAVYAAAGEPQPRLLFSTQFLDIRSYQGKELPRHFGKDNPVLAKVQLALTETIPPLSLHIGLLRIAIENGAISLLMDVIFDTTESDRNTPVFAHIIYDKALFNILSKVDPDLVKQLFGDQVQGF